MERMEVIVSIPAARIRIGTTRMAFRTMRGTLLGDVPFEPSLARVRIGSDVHRLPREYLTPVAPARS